VGAETQPAHPYASRSGTTRVHAAPPRLLYAAPKSMFGAHEAPHLDRRTRNDARLVVAGGVKNGL